MERQFHCIDAERRGMKILQPYPTGALTLDSVHESVGRLEQGLEVSACLLEPGDADAGGNRGEFCQRGGNVKRKLSACADRTIAVNLGQKDAEFVAADENPARAATIQQAALKRTSSA